MAGRYDGWHHKKGRSQASPEDLAAARKVLGELQNQLKLGNVPSGQRIVRLQNGSVVEATITMGQPSVRIHPARGGRRIIPARELGEFITVPRSAAAPDGVDPDHPEVMLRHAEEDAGPDLWRSYFFSATPGGFSGQGGTYVDMFPKGLGEGGNADWVGPDGERVSWYGPSSRAFADAYVHGTFQHGKKVFYLGDVLLDTDEFAEKSGIGAGWEARYVAGAALRKIDGTWWLYTVQYAAVPGTNPPPYTAPADSVSSSFFSYPLAETVSLDGGVYRYRLYPYVDPQGLVRFGVVTGSIQWLVGTVTGSPDPWFFNKECTEVICHLALTDTNVPGKPWWGARVESRDFPPDEDDVIPPDQQPHPPASSGIRLRVTFDDQGLPTASLRTDFSTISGGPPGVVTADYDFETDTLVEYTFRFGSDLVPYFGFDGVEVPTYQGTAALGAGTAGGHIITGLDRSILYANPRDHVVVLLKREVLYDTGAAVELQSHVVTLELYVDGVLVTSEEVATGEQALFGLVKRFGDTTDFLHNLAGVPITPQWWVFGALLNIADIFTAPGLPADPKSWWVAGGFVGANAMYAQLPYPVECWFGYADGAIPAGDTADTVASIVTAGFSGSAADDNGFYSVTGAARHEGVVVVSCWTPRAGMNYSFTYITDQDLQALTTVGGTNARYHPIRLLGKMPVEERVEETDR